MSVLGGTTTRPLIHASGDLPVDTSRVPAREAAERELSKPMYHENDPNLLERALDRIAEWIGKLFEGASGAAPGGPLGLVVVALIVVALCAALWWRLGAPRRLSAATGTLFDDGPRSAAQHRTTAEAHAATHRWTEAVQERMRAIVRSLEERALLDPRPGRTADEAASEAGRALPGHADRLRTAAREFDDVTYGGRTADERTYLRLRELDTDLERAKPHLSTVAGGTTE
ncbi:MULTISPECIES: DUF4129 domain-containing protein [unclassified Streptomyces]|uniref:DUF4129 domain-containing protein n=1 Tax=unclassified Streptomyces TaxID=2593676 RepID=UPI002E7A6018|nr:DUF4129 domain-containing protein [Streptomyces sp. JV176]MEE1801888.1 DUF4129 domain-containing protein [Streptomyces sp. JV176]